MFIAILDAVSTAHSVVTVKAAEAVEPTVFILATISGAGGTLA